MVGDHEATARSLVSLLPRRTARGDIDHETIVPRGTNAWMFSSIVAVIFIFILFVKLLTPEMASLGD